MKQYITGLLIAAALLLSGCNSRHKGPESNPENSYLQAEGNGHNHRDSHAYDPGQKPSHNHTPGGGQHQRNEAAAHSDEIFFTKAQAASVGLTTETVSPAAFSQVIKTGGQIVAAQGDEAVITATSNGIISFAHPSIAVGSAIGSGETIVTVSAKNILDGDPAVKAKIAYETAEAALKRAGELVKDSIVSAKEYEQARLRYTTARTVYEAQAGNTSAAGVRITSPIGGYLKNRLVAQGEYVSVGQPIATVSRNRRLQLKAEVAENYFGSLAGISDAHFKMAYGKRVYKLSELNGRLLSFGRTVDGQSFYIPVTFEFDNADDIIPGSFAEVYLLSTPQEQVISVPLSALTEEQGLYFVYLQLDEEGYQKREVRIGQHNGERVHILSGLAAGEKVVTQGAYQVKLAAVSSVMPEGHVH